MKKVEIEKKLKCKKKDCFVTLFMVKKIDTKKLSLKGGKSGLA